MTKQEILLKLRSFMFQADCSEISTMLDKYRESIENDLTEKLESLKPFDQHQTLKSILSKARHG